MEKQKQLPKSRWLVLTLLSLLMTFGGPSSAWAQQALPYSYGFEEAKAATSGWTKVDCHANTENYNLGSAAHGGSYAFRFYYNSTPPQYLISPELATTENTISVSFWYKAQSSSYEESFKFGYSSTDNNVASFTWEDEVKTKSTTWTEYATTCPAGTKYISIQYTANDKYYLFVDDMLIKENVSYGMSVSGGDVVGNTISFGTVRNATTSKTFTINNEGSNALTNVSVVCDDASVFTVSDTGFDIAAGATKDITVTFVKGVEGDYLQTITISQANIATPIELTVTGTYTENWGEDFSAGTLPTGWVITPGSYSGDTYAWHIGTYSDYENKTNMAIAPTSTTYNTILSPRLAAKENDVLTWDAYFNWSDEYMTVEWSHDGQTGWTTIYDQYKPQDESISTRYYHKAMSFTAPADGNYYLRFTSRYSNGVDNFSGFKLNPKTHDAVIASKTIPATGNQYVEYTATVTVNELLGKDDEVVTAELWIGATKVATEADVTLNASASKVIELTFTPATAMSGDAYIKVYNGDESINLTSDVQAVNIAAALVLDEDVAPGALTSGSKPSMVVNYNAKNGWNTICMPFALTSEILNSLFGTGWRAYEFKSYSAGALGFQNTTTFYAGYPYIIHIETAAVNAEGIKLFNTEIGYTGTTAKADTYGGVSFQGTYAPIAAPDMNGLWGVTSAGKIAKGSNTASLKGFRAYFTGGDLAGAHIAIFDDATGITTVLDAKDVLNDGKVYNLNGQRVENAHKGVFIVNGKKVVVK